MGELYFSWFELFRREVVAAKILASTNFVYGVDTSEKRDTPQELCRLGKAEGSYLAELETLGSVRVNLICAANGASIATLEKRRNRSNYSPEFREVLRF